MTAYYLTEKRTYRSWAMMLSRCRDPFSDRYPYYGARGITVCERWTRFENFLADMGQRPAGLSLDRIDNNGNYEHGNCRWATHSEQMLNRRSYNRQSGIKYKKHKQHNKNFGMKRGPDKKKEEEMAMLFQKYGHP